MNNCYLLAMLKRFTGGRIALFMARTTHILRFQPEHNRDGNGDGTENATLL
jgi:hypothetical protein